MTVTASIGPASGINYGTLLSGLAAADQASIDKVKSRVTKLGDQNNALLTLSTLVTSLRTSASNFSTSAIFRAATAASSDNSVLSATAGSGTPSGSYSFTVQRVASSSQLISQGYSDQSSALGTAGNLSFSYGAKRLDDPVKLAALNGGSGVARGSIRVIDSGGNTASIDLSNAVDLKDVVNTINSNTSVNVQAKIDGDKLVLTDSSGGTGKFSVSNLGSTTTASDLGLTQNAASGGVITGNDISKIGGTTSLDQLNDGLGVRNAGVLNDFAINTAANGALNVSLNGAKTIGDVISKINAAGKVNGTQVVTANVSSDGHGITLTQAGGGVLSVSALNNSNAAADLGLVGSSGSGTLTGSRVNQGADSALLKDLNGGSGVGLGTINITDKSGAVHSGIDLSGAATVNDVLKIINNANAGVTAAVDANGTGITLTDTTNGSGTITVANGSTGTAATDLGLAQTATGSTLSSGSLKERSISQNTLLSSLNGGSGVPAGKIALSDSTGATFTVDLTSSHTIGDVLTQINNNTTGIRASYDPNGNGILLTDSSGGSKSASVSDISNGTTAAALGIKGSFSSGKLDGSFNKTVAILSTDSLQNVANKINLAGIGVSASVINDGSGTNPYRLSLTSKNTGSASNLSFDGSALGISTSQLTSGQDAVVQYGNATSSKPLQITSASNTITGLVPNLTVNLVSASTRAVTVSVTTDTSKVPDAIQTFVDNYNKIVNNIATVTNFDANNSSNNGVLFGDGTTRQIQGDLSQFISQSFNGIGNIRTLGQLGITVGLDGTLSLNSDTLSSELASNASDVQTFFTSLQTSSTTNNVKTTTGTKGFGQQLSDLLTKLTDSSSGFIFQATDSIQAQEKEWNDRVSTLTSLLTAKENRLVQSFANLEVNISNIQSQQSSVSSIGLTTTTSSSTKS